MKKNKTNLSLLLWAASLILSCRKSETVVDIERSQAVQTATQSTIIGETNVSCSAKVGHHTVYYLGAVYNSSGNSTTARWVVRDDGCGSNLINGRKGNGGTGCNSMSHVAFKDFLNSADDLLHPVNGDYYNDACIGIYACNNLNLETSNCRETIYTTYFGLSKPDGPGKWIKYSTKNGYTVQLQANQTQVFHMILKGNYTGEAAVNVAIKSGNSVAFGSVLGPAKI
jgi:hypothetical protein